MPSLAEAIRKRNSQNISPEDMRSFIIQTAEDVIARRVDSLTEYIEEEVESEIREVVDEMISTRLTGPQGPQGERGNDGDTIVGPEGPVGPKGDSIVGPVGPQGPMGVGKAGKDGKDGSPDTPDQVVEKVNKADKKILLTAIDGLVKELDVIKRTVRERGGGGSSGGGGMGQPQHETKSVSSASTTVTTTTPISAGGRALWVYYQGQFLVYGTHYTVGADKKTLTLLFTPQDSTSIDITYIR